MEIQLSAKYGTSLLNAEHRKFRRARHVDRRNVLSTYRTKYKVVQGDKGDKSGRLT